MRSAARNKHFLSGREIGAVGSVVCNLTAFAPLLVTHAVGVLGPSYICLLKLKMNLAGKGFVTDVDVKQAATSGLNTRNTSFFCVGLEALVPLWCKCLKCMVATRRSGVYHLLRMCHVYIEVRVKFSASESLLLFETNLFRSIFRGLDFFYVSII